MSMVNEFFDIPQFDFELEKNKFIENLNFLKTMSVEEYTFYKKYEEVQSYGPFLTKASVLKSRIWTPIDINDEKKTLDELDKVDPTIVYVETKQQESDWRILRVFCHTMEFSQNPGRFLRFLITDGDKDNPRYLGAASVSSDVISITDRDKYIGWSRDNKFKDKKLSHSAICGCIMATQPFGYNFLGGKLVACLVTTSAIRDLWKKLYDQTLAGMTTTSLYGSYSMYNSLKWWHKCGSSFGKIPIKPDDVIYRIWHEWIKENRSVEYGKMTGRSVTGPHTGEKIKSISMICQTLGLKPSDYNHGYERGTYYSCFYNNTKDYLCNKITDDQLVMKPLIQQDKTGILDWWRIKAKNRYLKLKSENNLKTDILFYNKMIGISYDVAKINFFNEVGR